MCVVCGPGGKNGPMPGKFAYEAFSEELHLAEPRRFEEIVAMTPEEMAKASALVVGTFNELVRTAASIEEEGYRKLMLECTVAPKVTFLEMYPAEDDRRKMFDEMVRLGFFNAEDDPDHVWPSGNMDPQTYLTAPSSHNDFYNAHPGGLALTVAYNIRMAEAYTANYRQVFGVPINRDVSVAGLLIHEYPKVWLYQWQADGTWREEPRTVYDDTWHAHCIYVTAELMYRRFDSRIVMAMAAAHQLGMLDAAMDGRRVVTNWVGFDRVAHFIKAAAVLAQVDPVDYGLLERKDGKEVLAAVPAEQWITHLADMNWPYTMGGAHLYTEPMLREVAEAEYGVKGPDLHGRPFNQLKNYVWSQISEITLYEVLMREGRDAARAVVKRLVAA